MNSISRITNAGKNTQIYSILKYLTTAFSLSIHPHFLLFLTVPKKNIHLPYEKNTL